MFGVQCESFYLVVSCKVAGLCQKLVLGSHASDPSGVDVPGLWHRRLPIDGGSVLSVQSGAKWCSGWGHRPFFWRRLVVAEAVEVAGQEARLGSKAIWGNGPTRDRQTTRRADNHAETAAGSEVGKMLSTKLGNRVPCRK